MAFDPHEGSRVGDLAGVLNSVKENRNPFGIGSLGKVWFVLQCLFVYHFDRGRVADLNVPHDGRFWLAVRLRGVLSGSK